MSVLNSKLDQNRSGRSQASKSASSNTELRVSGMNCQSCVRSVANAIEKVRGVQTVDVNLDLGRAVVAWEKGVSPNADILVQAVEAAGYKAAPNDSNQGQTEQPSQHFLSGWKFNVVLGAAATLPLMLAEWVLGFGLERGYQWTAFALALPVQILCGARFYRGAWNQLKAGNSNMDTLVALGSTTAFVYSLWGLLAGKHEHLFFMESASIITLISIGHWVESIVSARAETSMRALLNLAPQTARLLTEAGEEHQLPLTQIQVGDTIVIKPGDRIPTDAEVRDGFSAVNESMLTGESNLVEKGAGANVFAGTLNTNGVLRVRVTATGEATVLAHIIEVVRRAQNSRANIQKLGDRVSSVFVPLVVLLAIATGFWWSLAPESALSVSRWFETFLWGAHHPPGDFAAAIYHAAAVLIIACPCAMGLATPVAIMAGANVASERGILIRDGIALEKTGQISAILFDKTGTLTLGKPTVVSVEEYAEGLPSQYDIQQLAASLAKPSQHPYSEAVARTTENALPVIDWKELRGAGVESRIKLDEPAFANTIFRLGSAQWLRELGIDFSHGSKFIQTWTSQGSTLLGLAMDQRLIALFALQDALKPNAGEMVRQLQGLGRAVYLITGDNKATALAVAQQTGIDPENVFSEIRPEKKAAIVQELQQRGQRVAFVGDGINDAPALEQADLGIAVSRASDVAREAADIVLLRSDLSAIPEALQLSQATLRTIKQNLFWAFFYNAAGVPLAMLGFMSPILSAVAMGMSDLFVILNALRLRRWKSVR